MTENDMEKEPQLGEDPERFETEVEKIEVTRGDDGKYYLNGEEVKVGFGETLNTFMLDENGEVDKSRPVAVVDGDVNPYDLYKSAESDVTDEDTVINTIDLTPTANPNLALGDNSNDAIRRINQIGVQEPDRAKELQEIAEGVRADMVGQINMLNGAEGMEGVSSVVKPAVEEVLDDLGDKIENGDLLEAQNLLTGNPDSKIEKITNDIAAGPNLVNISRVGGEDVSDIPEALTFVDATVSSIEKANEDADEIMDELEKAKTAKSEVTEEAVEGEPEEDEVNTGSEKLDDIIAKQKPGEFSAAQNEWNGKNLADLKKKDILDFITGSIDGKAAA